MICGVTFGGTQFSDKPSFSDLAAWMVAADVSIQMILKMILDFFRHRNKQKKTPCMPAVNVLVMLYGARQPLSMCG